MTADPRPMIHLRARNAFRETCSDHGTLRMIETVSANEGLVPASDDVRDWNSSGQHPGLFDRCTANLDWTNGSHVGQMLGVFEQILEWSMEASHRETLLRLLGRDGFTVDDAGRIRWRSGTLVMLAQIPLGALADASSINEHFDRIAASR